MTSSGIVFTPVYMLPSGIVISISELSLFFVIRLVFISTPNSLAESLSSLLEMSPLAHVSTKSSTSLTKPLPLSPLGFNLMLPPIIPKVSGSISTRFSVSAALRIPAAAASPIPGIAPIRAAPPSAAMSP